MFRLDPDSLALAASDVSNHLACAHLTQQRLAIARGERTKPRPADDPHADLVRERGQAHEAAQLEALIAECGDHVDLTGAPTFTREGLSEAHERACAAMSAGTPLIYQATLFDGTWQGRADFLRRVKQPSDLGDFSYEVIDTKLARQVKPQFVHQLVLYSNLVAGVQGAEPEFAHVLLGDNSTFPIRLSEYAALHRHVLWTLEGVIGSPPIETYPEPVSHCDICALQFECRQRLVKDYHLSLVAGAHRRRRELLIALGIETVAGLASAPADLDPKALGEEQFELLRSQAGLQVASRESGEPTRRYLKPAQAAGYALLPAPSPGDVFFDLEGDPYVYDEGLEYLWGWWTEDEGYECLWAHDPAAEKLALETFVDRVLGLRDAHPGLHVYHYAPHERAKLRSLAVKYATREAEVDSLLRNGVLTDLFAVVKQGMQVGEESYSLKRLERHHGFERTDFRVREGGGSIVAYETWLKCAADDLLDAIRAYNEEDCRSTASLRDWLLAVARPEAAAEFGVDFSELGEPQQEERIEPDWLPAVLDLIDRLTADLEVEPEEDTPEQATRRLLSHLLLFHRRESNPEWWRYFDLRSMTVDDLMWERDAIAGLRRDDSVAPEPYKQSLEYVFRFPPQEFKVDLGGVQDPIDGSGHNLVAIGDDFLKLRRKRTAEPPNPVALAAGPPIGAAVLRKSLVVLAEALLAGENQFPAAVALLGRETPRLAGGTMSEEVDDLSEAAIGLDRSILPIQGPPGTGKTYRAARMVLAALRAKKRVAITAPSHAAIKNLLAEVEKCAAKSGQKFAGVYKGYEYESEAGLVGLVESNDDVTDDYELVAGTAWLLAREEHRQAFDLLFIDEASQYSLANAVAVSLAAQSVVPLGDPQQLPQVTKASHPGGSGAAVLEHLLEDENTIQPDKGVLLTTSWRMHPDVCSFVSERSYDGRLRSREECSRRMIEAPAGALTGVGLRAMPVEHEGRSQRSVEEAEAIAAACRGLLAGGSVTDDEGARRPLIGEDILVVAPYNLAVRCILEVVPDGVRVGTVDRFQGQEAPVVFYAMTCSSGDDVPRGLNFLFDKNRLNVAISRAQCMSVLAYSPRLLDADCPTIEAMRLLDGVCRYAEVAETVGS